MHFAGKKGFYFSVYLVCSECVNIASFTRLCTEEWSGIFVVFLSRTFPFCSDSKCGEVVGVTMCRQINLALPFLVKAPFDLQSQLAPSAARRTTTAAAVAGLPQPCTGPLPQSVWQQEVAGVNSQVCQVVLQFRAHGVH